MYSLPINTTCVDHGVHCTGNLHFANVEMSDRKFGDDHYVCQVFNMMLRQWMAGYDAAVNPLEAAGNLYCSAVQCNAVQCTHVEAWG